MASASSVISVAIVGDSRKFQKAVGSADKSAKSLGGSMKGLALGIGGALAGLFAVNKAFEFIGDSLNEADRAGDAVSNLNRIIGAVNTKKLEAAADDFLKLGLSSNDVLELSVGFARIAKAIGLKPKLIADYADDVAAVAKAMSLVDEKGRDAAFWVEAISKAADKPGGGRAAKLLGINVNEARVIADALKATGKASADMLTPAEISSARFLQIMRKLAKVVPEALANPDLELKQAEMGARIEELQKKIGLGLQPIVQDLLTSLIDISESEWVADMMKGVDVVRGAIPGLITDFTEGFDLVNAAISEDVAEIQTGLLSLRDDVVEIWDALMKGIGFLGELGVAFDGFFHKIASPLATIADILNDIFGGDHTATFTVVESGTRAPRNSPGGGGDRATSDAVRREAERNGQRVVGNIPVVAVTYVQDKSAQISSHASSIAVTLTSTPTSGNTLTAIVGVKSAVTGSQVSPPSGWTDRSGGVFGFNLDTTSSLYVFTKVAGASEPTTVTIDLTLVTNDRYILVVYETTGAWGGVTEEHGHGGGTAHLIPAITPTAGADSLFVAVAYVGNAYTQTIGPGGYTLREELVTTGGASERMTVHSLPVNPTSGGPYTSFVQYSNGIDRHHQAHIYYLGTPPAPVADFEADVTSGVVPTTVIFTDLSDLSPTSWAWTFGDGGTSTSQNPSHVYSAAGLYTVSLTATNAFGSDTETKTTYINISSSVGYEPPLPGQALVEIYAAEPGAARWDVATWDDDVWSTAAWQDVTPQSVDARILWGSNRPELGILSKPDAGSWAIAMYDPQRLLDPANDEGPYFTDLLPGLPVRITHRGLVIRQGIMEALTHEFSDDSGILRVQDNIAPMANADVPSDTTLPDTLYARAVAAIAAAGLSITVLPPPPTGDPALAPWVTGVNEWTVWQWITDAAEQSLHIAYVDRIGRVGFRPWATPLARARELAADQLIGLTSIVQYNGQFSAVSALDDATDTVVTRALTPPPRYGVRTYARTATTLDGEEWAQAVLNDRAFNSLRWVPGTMYPLTADAVEMLATIEAVEQVGLVHSFTDPNVLANLVIVGGEIEITAKKDDEAKWWFTFEAAQISADADLPLITEDGLAFVVDETSGIDLVYPE